MERPQSKNTERGVQDQRFGFPRRRFIIRHFVCLTLLLPCASCRDPEAEKRAAVDAFFARARSCKEASEPEGNLKLAIASVTNTANETRVRLVAYAFDEAVDFDLPVYRLSAGRWLINEKGRAYLLDEQCREFKLNNRKSSSGARQIPLDGRIRLNPGQAFEATLVFYRLPDQTRVGTLVYAGRVLPFTLSAETQPAAAR
jgi:hypothetical protein